MTNMEVGKVFTVINPTKPLPEAVNVQFATGDIHRVPVSCPWLPPICTHYNKVGDNIRRCPTSPVTCLGCKATSHATEACPRNRKPPISKSGKKKHPAKGKTGSEVAKDVVFPKANQSRKKKKKKKKKKKHASSDSELEAEANHVTIKSVKPFKGNSPAAKGEAFSLEIGSGSETHSDRVKAKSHNKGKSGSSPSKSSSGSSSSSASDSDPHTGESSSPEPSSEEEADDATASEEEVPFTLVKSKKDRRFKRNTKGKTPKPSQSISHDRHLLLEH